MRTATLIRLLTCALLGLLAAGTARAGEFGAGVKPNIVFVLCDNLGNGDIACFNPKTKHRTPHIDRMAAEGLKLTSFYSCSGVCTPSRASFMTGCYPRRVNMHESDTNKAVLQPVAPKGLHPSETTIAETLKAAGYATAIIGKWHLGDQPEFLPTRQGFDSYYGIPYSDDMTRDKKPAIWPELPLMRDERVVEAPADRDTLTRRYTEEAIKFIRAQKDKPFFLYLPQAMPGSTSTPYASDAFKGKSANGRWGDSVEELDWSMGQILDELKQSGLDKRTLVIWTSDNGAPRRNPPQGSNAPYTGWGYNTSEGAMRMPCIAWWPGRIPPGATCDALCTMMDFLPTFAALAGAPLPKAPIDGQNMSSIWFGDRGTASPYDASGFFYYHLDQLQAVRSGSWKLYLELPNKRVNLAAGAAPAGAALYNVREDVAESTELSKQHPKVVAKLNALAEAARNEFGDGDLAGAGQRPAGHVEQPTARRKED